jgi:hypothetical protein
MHLPQSLIDTAGKPSKKKDSRGATIYKVNTSLVEESLEEFGITDLENTVQGYVCVSVGDILTVGVETEHRGEQIVDLVVDGILRENSIKKSNAVKHHVKFDIVCHNMRIGKSRGNGKLQHCDMAIEDRITAYGRNIARTYTQIWI